MKDIQIEEPNVQPVNVPITQCGDIHGQFYDLQEQFSKSGKIPKTKYMFMGDFVDRGYHSVETIQLLFCYKVQYPDRVTQQRGNHECRQITQSYGFYDECQRKYGSSNVWRYFVDVFDYLSISSLINNRIFCVHGGQSPDLASIDEIRLVHRNGEIPHQGPFCDLMWSDPEDIVEWAISPRGAGWVFGSQPTAMFNYINNTELICRAHQLMMEGYMYMFNEKSLLTIWSAPNYCYRCNNVASVLELYENFDREIIRFNASSTSIPTPSATYFQ